jgi:hypothetical protein
MRVYGRIPKDPLDPKGPKKWVVVETDKNGFNDACYITAMAQTLKLNLNESPFWANFGIPAKQSVIQQIAPNLYIFITQLFYQQFFSSLIVSKVPQPDDITPAYRFSVTTKQGFHADINIGNIGPQ